MSSSLVYMLRQDQGICLLSSAQVSDDDRVLAPPSLDLIHDEMLARAPLGDRPVPIRRQDYGGDGRVRQRRDLHALADREQADLAGGQVGEKLFYCSRPGREEKIADGEQVSIRLCYCRSDDSKETLARRLTERSMTDDTYHSSLSRPREGHNLVLPEIQPPSSHGSHRLCVSRDRATLLHERETLMGRHELQGPPTSAQLSGRSVAGHGETRRDVRVLEDARRPVEVVLKVHRQQGRSRRTVEERTKAKARSCQLVRSERASVRLKLTSFALARSDDHAAFHTETSSTMWLPSREACERPTSLSGVLS